MTPCATWPSSIRSRSGRWGSHSSGETGCSPRWQARPDSTAYFHRPNGPGDRYPKVASCNLSVVLCVASVARSDPMTTNQTDLILRLARRNLFILLIGVLVISGTLLSNVFRPDAAF